MNSPLDADAVLRDDALLDAIGHGVLPPEFAADPAARLLLAWRHDIARPFAAPTDFVAPTDFGEPTDFVGPAGPDAGRASWLSRRVTIAAAIGVIAAGSLGSVAAASIAEPGDALWPITRVVYTERAESLEAREDALLTIRAAQSAAARHEPERAKRLLDEARHKASRVREPDQRAAITDEVAKVLATIESGSHAPAPAKGGPAAPSPRPSTGAQAVPSPEGSPAVSGPPATSPVSSPPASPLPEAPVPSTSADVGVAQEPSTTPAS